MNLISVKLFATELEFLNFVYVDLPLVGTISNSTCNKGHSSFGYYYHIYFV